MHLFPSLIIFASAVRAGSVMESSSNYSCCDDPTIEFDQNCAVTFSTNNQLIADSNGKDCVSPCKKIEAGRMTLDRCVDMEATLVYTEGSRVTEEKRIHHHGQPCSGSNSVAAGNLGLVGLLLLVLGIAGCL
ncbi:hypothetical protein VZT92_027846 [Zoarces viviparus]|uniref:Uncharacterized protein n=1 Tax=Zoarces viviparus TaxID=48416 RepID=A0AAW1DY65_ZOAVI